MGHRPKCQRWNNKASRNTTGKHLYELQIGKGFLKRTQRPNFKGKTEIGHQYSKDITKYKKGRLTGD